MSSNSAVLVRLYPNAHQAELFRKVCRYRMHFAVARNFTETVKKGKAKGTEKNYGDVFRLNALYMPAQFGKSPASVED